MRPLIVGTIAAVLFALLIPGCSQSRTAPEQASIIDWVDFIQYGGETYTGMYNSVLSDPALLDRPLGTVKFNVSANVHDPSYTPKDGDAAFLQKGTVLYGLKGVPDHSMLAVKEASEINGYRLYCVSGKYPNFPWPYKSLPKEQVIQAEIYRADHGAHTKLKQLQKRDAAMLIDLLDSAVLNKDFIADTKQIDPQTYEIVVYTGQVFAYRYHVFYDHHTYYWCPWDTELLPDKIGSYLTP